MKESRLDKDLNALAKRPRPELPADFNEKVWSRVRSRERRAPAKQESWLNTFRSLFQTPQWAVAGFALAIFVGWMAARTTIVPGANLNETRMAASVTGEVIDMACYFDNGACGPAHAECAKMCIASGLPVGLKTRNGTIYVLIGKQLPPSPQPAAMHESMNAQLAQYAAKIVTVSGTVVSKRGMNVIENAQLLHEEAQWEQNPDQITELKAHLAHFL
jgi:hypothetical protein